MRQQLKQRQANAIDQKMTTALLAYARLKYGDYINILMRKGFLGLPWRSITRVNSDLIHEWLNQKIKQIKKSVKNCPFIVIHHRLSSNANTGQTLSPEIRQAIAHFLAERDIKYFCLRISDKKPTKCPNIIDGFEPENIIDVFESVDELSDKYDKFRHIQLLQAVACMPNFLGIIGGTSGTLDVAAFMGIKVFNIHEFTNASKTADKLIPYQDYRILLQAQFMTVCRALSTDQTGNLVGQEVILLSQWLGNFKQLKVPVFTDGRSRYIDGDRDDHNDRIPFQYCLLLREEEDGEENSICIERKTGNLYVTPANRFFKQQKEWLERSLKMSSLHSKAGMLNRTLLVPSQPYSRDDFDLPPDKRSPSFSFESPF